MLEPSCLPFNPDDGKQPKTFGSNILILRFLTVSLVNGIYFTKANIINYTYNYTIIKKLPSVNAVP